VNDIRHEKAAQVRLHPNIAGRIDSGSAGRRVSELVKKLGTGTGLVLKIPYFRRFSRSRSPFLHKLSAILPKGRRVLAAQSAPPKEGWANSSTTPVGVLALAGRPA
jgi:hypothetical protein